MGRTRGELPSLPDAVDAGPWVGVHALAAVLHEPALLLAGAGRGRDTYRVAYANESAARSLRTERRALLGSDLAGVLPEDTRSALFDLCARAVHTGRPAPRRASAPDALADLGGGPAVVVQATPIGGRLLCTWLPAWSAPGLDAPAGPLGVADRLRLADGLELLPDAGLGMFTLDLTTGRVVWSRGMYAIFDRDPATGPIEVADVERYVDVGADRPVRAAWLSLIRDAVPLEIEVTVRGWLDGLRRLRIRACVSAWSDGYPSLLCGDCRVLDGA